RNIAFILPHSMLAILASRPHWHHILPSAFHQCAIIRSVPIALCRRWSMSKKHTYVLGLNTYDHDVSACLLRDGEIAFAIAKERITREKHASGFYKEVIDYCLEAEGITLDDVDLVVRNCYILPVPEMEERLVYFDAPGFLPEFERGD